MLLGIDHLVLAAEDPDAAAAELEAKLGIAATGGGRHESMGTFNRLIWLGDAYLELIGVFDRSLARESWLGRPVLAAFDEGRTFVTWAIAVDDLDGALRWGPPDSGLDGPIDGQRRRTDERVVRWRLVHPAVPTPTQPIVIEHDRTAAEWTPDERAARAEERHPLGGRVRLAGIEVATSSPAVAAGALRRSLATAVEPAGRNAVRVRIAAHEVRFIVERPRGTAGIDLLADVPLRTRAVRLGDCDIRLRGAAVEVVPDPVPDEAPDVPSSVGADAGASRHPEDPRGV
jgi:hypothetical protein